MAGVVALAFFYFLPPNKEWLDTHVPLFWHVFPYQRTNLNLEARKRARYGRAYTCSKEITDFFDRKGMRGQVLVLVPGTLYFSARHFPYEVPEPAVFYYYTGLKTVRPADTNAAQANWYVHVQAGKLVMDSVTNPTAFADSIRSFKKTDASL